jgi:hypothetical protein
MKTNYYKIISEAIENGIDCGWNRAHKHTINPSAEHIKEQVEHYIMHNICEIFDFDNDSESEDAIKANGKINELQYLSDIFKKMGFRDVQFVQANVNNGKDKHRSELRSSAKDRKGGSKVQGKGDGSAQ